MKLLAPQSTKERMSGSKGVDDVYLGGLLGAVLNRHLIKG